MKKYFLYFLFLCLIISGVVLFIGINRYGSLSGLAQRIQLEAGRYIPQEEVIIPTFVPQEQVSAEEFVAQVSAQETLPAPAITEATALPAPATEPAEATPSAEPTITPTSPPTLTPTPSPTPIYALPEQFINLSGYRHHWQTWNNCGPATLATYLSFYQKSVTQVDTAAVLKPNERDKNVRVDEITSYVGSRFPELNVTSVTNGSPETLKILLANGFPIMIQTWLEEEPDDGMGHYRFVVGYDDQTDEWIVSDSYVSTGVESPYAGIRIPNQKFIDHWFVFDNIFILVYLPEDSVMVEAIVGEDLNKETNLEKALAYYTDQLQVQGDNPFVWHTLGDLLLEDGRPDQAAQAYDQARAIGLPWRMFWYNFEIFEAYYATGRYKDLIELADQTIDSGGPGEEIYYWKGLAHEALGEEAAANRAFEQGLWWNPTHKPTIEQLSN